MTRRSTEEIHEQLCVALLAMNDDARGVRYERFSGFATALSWVQGLQPTAPVSGKDKPNPGDVDLYYEYADAHEMALAHRGIPEDDLSPEYVDGAAMALGWATGRYNDPDPLAWI